MAGDNNFLVFNVANDAEKTMSDADYLADSYRINGLIPMIADPVAHNKMYRQWSIMVAALGGLIAEMDYNADDSDVSTLQGNLKLAIEDVAEAKVDTRISNLEDWKDDITATTTEINYLSGAESNIQNQIDSISGSIATPFPAWIKNTAYAVGDICICTGFDSYKYLECVVAGTTDTTAPANTNIGQLITDNTVKWLVCDWRDSSPVGTYKTDIVQRNGWLKVNGAEVNRADYPRLWAWAIDNSLTTNDVTNNPGLFGTGDGSITFTLPNFEDYFIRYSYTRAVGTKQASQMAQHSHSCGNESANHAHRYVTYYNYKTIKEGTGSERIEIWQGAKTEDSANENATHSHTIGNTGSGSNTYPDNITMQMYIKY